MRSYRRGKGRRQFDPVGPKLPLGEEAGLIAYEESKETPEGPDLTPLMLGHQMAQPKERRRDLST